MTNPNSDLPPLRAFYYGLIDAQRQMVLGPQNVGHVTAVAELGEVVGTLDEGLGANLTPIYQKNQDLAYPGTDEQWDRLLAHVDWLGIKIIRYWLFGDAVLPAAGAPITREHVYLQRLRRFDAWARRRGVRLLLDFSVIPSWLRYPAPPEQPSVLPMNTGPTDVNRYVEQFAMPLVKHVVQELKLESVRYLCLFNEPFNVDLGMDTFYTPRGVDPFQRYVELHVAMRDAMDRAGISRDRLALIGPNSFDLYLQPLAEMKRRGLDLLSHIDLIDEHAYRMRFDYLPEARHVATRTMTETIESMLRPAVRSAHDAGKPYALTEYSCFYYNSSADGPTRHESTITEAEFIVRALAEGITGALRYSLINSGEADGRWQLVNTADGSYAPSPNIYYAYAILSRYAPRGGQLRRLMITAPDGRRSFIHGVAIEYPNDLTVLLVNDHPGEVIVVDLPHTTGRPLSAWQTDATHKHREVTVDRRADRATVVLPPMSVSAVTTFRLNPHDPGLI